MLVVLALLPFGCDHSETNEPFRQGEMACWQICPPGEECMITCVPVGDPTPPSGTDTGTGTDDSSITDTGTEDTAGEVHP